MSDLRIEKVSSQRDFALVACLRTLVYVVEQNCPILEEFDSHEGTAEHYLGFVGDQPATSCRILYEGDTAKIGRVVTLKEFRKKGLASIMIEHSIGRIREKGAASKISLSAQEQAINLYARLGFEAYGEAYMEAGIPHRMMSMSLK